MKILWLTIDREARVAQHFDMLRNAVGKIADVTSFVRKLGMLQGPYSRKAMLGDVTEKPILPMLLLEGKYDFIMCDAIFAFFSEDWNSVKIPKGVFLEDMHRDTIKYQAHYLMDNDFDIIFHRYNDAMKKYHPYLFKKSKCIWVPHAVGHVFRYYGEKTRDVVLTGRISKPYPIRQEIIKRLKGKPYFERYDRPPETVTKVEKYPVGIDYAKLISSAKIHPTCGGKFHYPVMKYFEIPACRTLLIADWFNELGSLGFKDNVNMVKLNRKKLKEQVEYWLTHDAEREEIARAGEILIQQRHTVDIRVREFIEHLEGLEKGYPFK